MTQTVVDSDCDIVIITFVIIVITGRICRRQLCRYCFYWVFRPAGATRCTDEGEIWHGGADLRCTIFTKFTSFMRVLSLHNFAKYGSFISISEKIINLL